MNEVNMPFICSIVEDKSIKYKIVRLGQKAYILALH